MPGTQNILVRVIYFSWYIVGCTLGVGFFNTLFWCTIPLGSFIRIVIDINICQNTLLLTSEKTHLFSQLIFYSLLDLRKDMKIWFIRNVRRYILLLMVKRKIRSYCKIVWVSRCKTLNTSTKRTGSHYGFPSVKL